MLQATLPEIKLALSSKSRDLLSHVISECMQMRGRIGLNGFGAQILHKLLSFGQIHDTRDTLGLSLIHI